MVAGKWDGLEERQVDQVCLGCRDYCLVSVPFSCLLDNMSHAGQAYYAPDLKTTSSGQVCKKSTLKNLSSLS